jgi:hypothetical protein
VRSIPILCVLGVLCLSLTPSTALGQADLRLTQEQGDSAAAGYNYIFPLMGKKVVERGFDIPYPFGISGNFLSQRFDVLIDGLELSLGDAELVPIDIVKFKSAGSRMVTGNIRGDLWVLPFLNVSAMYGDGTGRTSVALEEPIEFSTEVEYRGKYYGFGIMGAFGIDRFFFTVDWSQTWFDSDILDKPVLANIGGLRAGRTFDVKGKNLSVWIGTMYQNYENETVGEVTGEEIFGGGLQERLEGYEDTEWYQDLGRLQQEVVDQIAEGLLAVDPSQVKINYSINKKPAEPWNFLVGSRFEFNKTWEVRAEAGFIGREQILVSLAYRWPW